MFNAAAAAVLAVVVRGERTDKIYSPPIRQEPTRRRTESKVLTERDRQTVESLGRRGETERDPVRISQSYRRGNT